MVIRGEESTLLDPETLPRMAEAQPKLVTLSVPNCGHAPMLDSTAQVDPIRDFLNRPAPRPVPSRSMQNATGWQRVVQWLSQQWRRWWK